VTAAFQAGNTLQYFKCKGADIKVCARFFICAFGFNEGKIPYLQLNEGM